MLFTMPDCIVSLPCNNTILRNSPARKQGNMSAILTYMREKASERASDSDKDRERDRDRNRERDRGRKRELECDVFELTWMVKIDGI